MKTASLGFSLLLLAACSKSAPPDATPTEASAAPIAITVVNALALASAVPVAPSAVPAEAVAPPTPAESAAGAVTAAVAASAAPEANTRSGRPTPAAWCAAPIAMLPAEGDSAKCSMIVVNEWAMIWCPTRGMVQNGKDLGTYDRALPNGGSMATEEELAMGARGEAKDAIVVSLRPGTRAKADFTYRPSDHPEWLKTLSFTLELGADAKSLAERQFDGGAWPAVSARDTAACERMAAAEAAIDAKGLPDLADLAAPPSDADWDAAKEVNVSGSGALGCQTKVIEPWFRMTCEGKGAFSSVEVEKGRRATQTQASVVDGKLSFLTPYVEESSARVKLVRANGTHYLRIAWGKGKRPIQVGAITAQ